MLIKHVMVNTHTLAVSVQSFLTAHAETDAKKSANHTGNGRLQYNHSATFVKQTWKACSCVTTINDLESAYRNMRLCRLRSEVN
jgi:hypothetical protein